MRNSVKVPELIQKTENETFDSFLLETCDGLDDDEFDDYNKEFGAIYTGKETILTKK